MNYCRLRGALRAPTVRRNLTLIFLTKLGSFCQNARPTMRPNGAGLFLVQITFLFQFAMPFVAAPHLVCEWKICGAITRGVRNGPGSRIPL